MEKVENLRDEEKLLSLFCHFSVFFGGLLVPIIIWAYQKEKSKFVRFHALQSIFGHLLFSVVIVIFVFLFIGISVVTNISFFENSAHSHVHNDLPPVLIGLIIIFALFIMLAAFTFIGFSIYWGVKAYNGYLCRIPFIGKKIYEKVYPNGTNTGTTQV